jgi:chromosome segregation protein
VHLRSLSLKGFKSFPDRTTLEFSPGVSVIVGPNGSGKSNVTDAVLWAMGEQSPLAVRGQSMQDVIFAGAHGVQARQEAEVEVVLDNADGAVDVPFTEVSIRRRLDRSGEGEYRINDARCRLTDVLDLLSDTGLGKEMHSVVSQGRVEAIVTSKARDRRLLIEEAAGLGKHRKRRRRAQLKLDRTQDNLDRSLDVEREARTRLRPLKRQAEAAELHERLERQATEARWELAREASRAAAVAVAGASAAVEAARAAAKEADAELAVVAARRAEAERALAARGDQRDGVSGRFHAAKSAADRIAMRREAAAGAADGLERRIGRRRATLAGLEAEAAADVGDPESPGRIAGLEAELAKLAEDGAARLAREVAELETARQAADVVAAERAAEAEGAAAARKTVEAAADAARAAAREVDARAAAARREAARAGAELAKVNQFLRAQAGAPGGAPALADALRAAPGYELALVAALGPRLRAAVADSREAALALLERAGRDGGAALVVPGEGAAVPPAGAPPCAGAVPLLDHVEADGAAAGALAARLLAGAWVVDDVAAPGEDFDGIAVTRDGRVWSPAGRELRRVAAGGEDRVLAERNRREALVAEVEAAARAEQAVLAEAEAAGEALSAADRARNEADGVARAAFRARDEALEAARHAKLLVDRRRSAPDDGPDAGRRAQLESALAAEHRLAKRMEAERAERERRTEHERGRLARDEALAPQVARLGAALEAAEGAVRARLEVLEAELAADRAAGEQLAGELRSCAAEEQRVQALLRERGEAVTREEVRAAQARDAAAAAGRTLGELAERLGLAAEAAPQPLPDEERVALEGRLERLARRREQLGPVNPLAQQEYAEAVAHVEELEGQREDLETALRELQTLVKETDARIREAFESTFTAAAKNFEEVVPQLFPGGSGRLRLVREDAGPRPVLGGAEAPGADDEDDEAGPELAGDGGQAGGGPDDDMGVEIEITPAGKSTKRLTLLSGGEKSMTALAFLFAVFLARPCPFYILDEVEAALDDLNIDRFLTMLGQFSDRAQFIVVTHQKRTMEAADCLYGVSMAGNGVSKVISRKLPRAA